MYLVKQHVTATNVNGDTFVHAEGSVISDWELSDFIREKVKEGSGWYRERYEPLSSHEAFHYRAKATAAEGDRFVEGEKAPVKAPWEDYVGLHPTEITDRMRDADIETVQQVKLYERGGMARAQITDFVHPAEREPFHEYDAWPVRQVLDKLAVSPDTVVADVKSYEKAHKNREAIVTWERALFEGTTSAPAAAVT